MPTPRKKGTCTLCGKPTSRTSYTVCAACNKPKPREIASGVANGTTEVTHLSNEPIKTLADLIRVCDIDTSEWEVSRWTANKWDSLADNADAKYQVKATLVPKVKVIQAREEIGQMVKDAQGRMPKPLGKPKRVNSGCLVELMIPDLHLGKLAWGEETGYENYDSKEAQRRYREAVATLMQRTAAFPPERIVLVVGNDFFHSDNKAGTTTKGTPLDNDSRFPKMFTEGRRLLTDVITELHSSAPVSVVVAVGNHDSVSSFTLGEALACWFRNTPTVDIINKPTPRKYMEWGVNMLMWEHGDKGKHANLPLLMATEQPEMFARTKFREAHVGHLHKLETSEHMGIRVRVCPALSGTDAWHSENHFIGNLQQATAFVWHNSEGLIAQGFYSV
jgi:hypothetical protein